MTNTAYNLVMGLLALMIWGVVAGVIQISLKQLWLSHNTAGFVGMILGFIITFIGFSYVYYRSQIDAPGSPSFLGSWKLMFDHWRNS